LVKAIIFQPGNRKPPSLILTKWWEKFASAIHKTNTQYPLSAKSEYLNIRNINLLLYILEYEEYFGI